MAGMSAPRRRSYLRELRHDFRHWYHVGYDEVETDEAADLALMLPAGSAYMRALDPHLGWSTQESLIADVHDQVARMIQIYATRTTEGARLHERPGDREDRAADRMRARRVREVIENTRWEEV